ncbi:MAG TPA: type II toxin-antitoxin system PemK/MazF family toxin [Candidatus Baltobacteraceae bacterium]|nr:type II toxin-antitoxin system PemK/MazF family toxin [Candidatus Baltobacteraceae bacterium]
MPTSELWSVVRVPFPYTDRPIRHHRPALVVAANDLQSMHALLWVLMITSAENRGWPEDVLISDHKRAGLPVPSLVRCAKIATIDAQDAESIGMLPSADRKKIARHVRRVLAPLLDSLSS